MGFGLGLGLGLGLGSGSGLGLGAPRRYSLAVRAARRLDVPDGNPMYLASYRTWKLNKVREQESGKLSSKLAGPRGASKGPRGADAMYLVSELARQLGSKRVSK